MIWPEIWKSRKLDFSFHHYLGSRWCRQPKTWCGMLIYFLVPGSNPMLWQNFCNPRVSIYFVDKFWVSEASSLSLIQSCLCCLEGSQGTNQKMNNYEWKIWNKNVLFWNYLGKITSELLKPPSFFNSIKKTSCLHDLECSKTC